MTSSTTAASFEDTIRNLGQIVEKLEQGELTLEESLQAFEQGIALARDAQRRLDAAEARIEELIGFDAQGRVITKTIEVPTSLDTTSNEPKPT